MATALLNARCRSGGQPQHRQNKSSYVAAYRKPLQLAATLGRNAAVCVRYWRGSARRTVSFCVSDRERGKSILNRILRSPWSLGRLLMGMPCPRTTFTLSGPTTCAVYHGTNGNYVMMLHKDGTQICRHLIHACELLCTLGMPRCQQTL